MESLTHAHLIESFGETVLVSLTILRPQEYPQMAWNEFGSYTKAKIPDAVGAVALPRRGLNLRLNLLPSRESPPTFITPPLWNRSA